MKKIYFIAATILLVISLFALVSLPFKTKKGKIIDQCIKEGNEFNIRITVNSEEGILLPVPGAYYTYEHQNTLGNDWHHITTFKHDDKIIAPCGQINYINNSIAYFFISWIYGVTTDGGKTWFLWDAEKDLEDWQLANYEFIQNIELNKDGEGVMHLKTIRFHSHILMTNDFGKNWRVGN